MRPDGIVSHKHESYTLRTVRTPDGTINFLALEALSDYGALRLVLA